jgi:hypothetical protein
MNPLEKFQCLVCGKEMEITHKIKYVDHFCSTQEDHHFSWRIVGGNLAKLRIRFQDGNERLCLKVHYDENYSEVWTGAKSERLRINQIIEPNFQDIEKLKNKLRTILVFS